MMKSCEAGIEINGFTEGKHFDVEILDKNSPVTVTAIHGGKIEPATSELACGIAGDQYNYYVLRGKLPQQNFEQLHVPSTVFFDPRLTTLLEKSKVLVSIHGMRGGDEVQIGGRNFLLGMRIAESLEVAGFNACISHFPLEGRSLKNVVNRTNNCGTQLEIGAELREQILLPHHNPLLVSFVAATRKGIDMYLQDVV